MTLPYTALSARYADESQGSAIIETAERGTVVLSPTDTPGDWAALMQSGLSVAAYMPPAAPPVALITWKSDVWRRCTDGEAEALDASLQQTTVKLRRLWDDSQQLDHSTDEFAMLRSQMEGVFGVSRTAEILAPST